MEKISLKNALSVLIIALIFTIFAQSCTSTSTFSQTQNDKIDSIWLSQKVVIQLSNENKANNAEILKILQDNRRLKEKVYVSQQQKQDASQWKATKWFCKFFMLVLLVFNVGGVITNAILLRKHGRIQAKVT